MRGHHRRTYKCELEKKKAVLMCELEGVLEGRSVRAARGPDMSQPCSALGAAPWYKGGSDGVEVGVAHLNDLIRFGAGNQNNAACNSSRRRARSSRLQLAAERRKRIYRGLLRKILVKYRLKSGFKIQY